MKKIVFIFLFFLFLLLVSGGYAQSIPLFGTTTAIQDTAVFDSTAGSTTSYWFEWSDPDQFEGAAGLWHAVYSGGDGTSVTIILAFRTRNGEDASGNYRLTGYTTLDSLTTSEDTSVRYGEGDQVGQTVSLGSQISNYAPGTEIQFRWSWTCSEEDTAEISAALQPVNP